MSLSSEQILHIQEIIRSLQKLSGDLVLSTTNEQKEAAESFADDIEDMIPGKESVVVAMALTGVLGGLLLDCFPEVREFLVHQSFLGRTQ